MSDANRAAGRKEDAALQEMQEKRELRRYLEEEYDSSREIIVWCDEIITCRKPIAFAAYVVGLHLIFIYCTVTSLSFLTLFSLALTAYFFAEYFFIGLRTELMKTRMNGNQSAATNKRYVEICAAVSDYLCCIKKFRIECSRMRDRSPLKFLFAALSVTFSVAYLGTMISDVFVLYISLMIISLTPAIQFNGVWVKVIESDQFKQVMQSPVWGKLRSGVEQVKQKIPLGALSSNTNPSPPEKKED
eukprot:Nk52_evm16s288 gene=Nk52_evmTU16s288